MAQSILPPRDQNIRILLTLVESVVLCWMASAGKRKAECLDVLPDRLRRTQKYINTLAGRNPDLAGHFVVDTIGDGMCFFMPFAWHWE